MATQTSWLPWPRIVVEYWEFLSASAPRDCTELEVPDQFHFLAVAQFPNRNRCEDLELSIRRPSEENSNKIPPFDPALCSPSPKVFQPRELLTGTRHLVFRNFV